MGAVEHLKTLCCLGLKPESAMIAVTPLLHEIIPYGWSRIMLLKRDATPDGGFSEHPETVARRDADAVGIQLVLGKPKPVIADELGIQLSSVADLTKRLYQILCSQFRRARDKNLVGPKQAEARQNLRRAG